MKRAWASWWVDDLDAAPCCHDGKMGLAVQGMEYFKHHFCLCSLFAAGHGLALRYRVQVARAALCCRAPPPATHSSVRLQCLTGISL